MKENAISEIECANEILKADLEKEKRSSDNDDLSVDSVTISRPLEKSSDTKTRSFQNQQLIIDKLKPKINELEIEFER